MVYFNPYKNNHIINGLHATYSYEFSQNTKANRDWGSFSRIKGGYSGTLRRTVGYFIIIAGKKYCLVLQKVYTLLCNNLFCMYVTQ